MKKTLLALTLSTLAGVATAQGFINEPAAYGGLGYAKLSFDDDGQLSGTSQDDDDKGIHFWGGYRFNQYFAVELSARDLGEYTASGPDFRYEEEFSAVTIGAVGFLPLGDYVSLYGRIGAGWISLDEKLTTSSYRISDDDSGGVSTLGAGVEFRPMGRDKLAIRLGWESHFFTVETKQIIRVGNVSILIEDDYDQRIDSFGLDVAYYFSL